MSKSIPQLFLSGDDQRLCTQVGHRNDGNLVSTGQQGYLTYGPFIKLQTGNYRIVINGAMEDYGNEGAYADVAIDGGKQVLAKCSLGQPDAYGCLGVIEISHENIDALIEIRVWVSEGCCLAVSSISVLPNFSPVLRQNLHEEHDALIPVWVVITGIVRDEEFILKRLHFFAALKKTGHIHQVVFSTWKGEISKFQSVANLIVEFDFVLVESDAPEVICHGHYLHQIISIENGLDVCPDNCFVFKTRTDKSGPESHFFEDKVIDFFNKKNYQRKCDSDSPLLSYKIGLCGLYFTEKSLHLPTLFFWNDINYFGLKEDLQKLLNHNVLSYGYQKLIPEQALFASYFANYWPSLSTFFKCTNQWELIVKFIFHGNEITRDAKNSLTKFLTSNRLFRHAFIAERYILHKYFFDIPSGSDIELDTKYRGIELKNDEESKRILDPMSTKTRMPIGYSAESESLRNYLATQFSITEVRKKTANPEGKHFVYDLPSSGLVIKEQK